VNELSTLRLGESPSQESIGLDLTAAPHVLIAGASGSGKSMLLHSLIAQMLARFRPDRLKLMLIDTKAVELTLYEGIAHLYDPATKPSKVQVITDPQRATRSLEMLVCEMEKRFDRLRQVRARRIEDYNVSARQPMPYVVVVIDELADLMLTAPSVIEGALQRLTQQGRAVGMHLIVATQRPSVDVITGTIKANFLTRIAMKVASKVDSRVILDQTGAEALEDRGDFLYRPSGGQVLVSGRTLLISSRQIDEAIEVAQGLACYDELKSIPKELVQVLKVLQLIRDSGVVPYNRLVEHLGSTVKAANMLSLLETKGYVSLQPGRRQIYWERIDEALPEASPRMPHFKTTG